MCRSPLLRRVTPVVVFAGLTLACGGGEPVFVPVTAPPSVAPSGLPEPKLYVAPGSAVVEIFGQKPRSVATQPVSRDELTAAFDGVPRPALVLVADKNLPYADVVMWMDHLQALGFTQISLSTP